MPETELIVVNDWSEVPTLRSAAAAARFWDTHSLADHLLAQSTRGLYPETAPEAQAARPQVSPR